MNFLAFLLLLISCLYYCGQKKTWYDFSLPKFVVLFCGLTYAISSRMIYAQLRRMFILLFDEIFCMCLLIHFVYTVVQIQSFLIDSQYNLSNVDSEVLQSSTTIVLLFISPFSSVNICFISLGALMLGAYLDN